MTSTSPAIETQAAHSSAVGHLRALQSVWILVVLIVITAIFGVLAPTTFLTPGNLTSIAQNVSIWAVLAVGMTFVIMTSGVDLSIGSVLIVSSVVAAKVMEPLSDTWGTALLGLLLSTAVGVVWGMLNGALIAKAKVPPLIVTLGTLSVALGCAQIITGGNDIRSAPTVLQDSIGYGRVAGIPILVVIALVIVVLGGTALHFTRFGRYTYAIGSNETAARRIGINVDRKLIQIYAMTGFLAGVAGFLSLAQFGTTTIGGQTLTNLNVIAAVVIGGTSIFGGVGTLFGSMVGLFIPATLQAGFVIIGVSPYWQTVAVGSILIVAVFIDQRRRAAAVRGLTT